MSMYHKRQPHSSELLSSRKTYDKKNLKEKEKSVRDKAAPKSPKVRKKRATNIHTTHQEPNIQQKSVYITHQGESSQ